MKKTLLVLVALLIVLLASCATTTANVKAEEPAVVSSTEEKVETFEVLTLSKYGDCRTDLTNQQLKSLGLKKGDKAIVTLNGKTFEAKVCERYEEVSEGSPLVKISDKYDVAFAIRMGSMSDYCGGAQVGATGTIKAK